jgi:hypothetical protein
MSTSKQRSELLKLYDAKSRMGDYHEDFTYNPYPKCLRPHQWAAITVAFYMCEDVLFKTQDSFIWVLNNGDLIDSVTTRIVQHVVRGNATYEAKCNNLYYNPDWTARLGIDYDHAAELCVLLMKYKHPSLLPEEESEKQPEVAPLPTAQKREIILGESFPVARQEQEQEEEEHSESDESDGDEYLAQVGDHPYSSENHIAQTKPGEVLVGGTRRRRRPPPRGQRQMGQRQRRGKLARMAPTPDGIPDRQRVKFHMLFTGNVTNTMSTKAITARVGNTYHSPDQSTVPDVAGKAACDLMFNERRFLLSKYITELLNLNTFPVWVYILLTNILPTTTDAKILSTNPLAKRFLLGPAGTTSAKKIVRYTLDVVKVVGSKAPLFDDTYAAVTGTDPADKVWMSICVDGDTNNLSAAGVVYSISQTISGVAFGRALMTQ